MNAPELPDAAPRGVLGDLTDLVQLTKPRLNSLTIFAVACGWWVGAEGAWEPVALTLTCLGAWLIASGAAAVNQALEWRHDAQMERTADRPVAAGRMSVREATLFGTLLGGTGLALLYLSANPLAAVYGLVCFAWYVAIYTPLKRRTTLNTLAGTLPGALPPVIGAAAAAGEVVPAAWFLFSIVLVWQLPHFLSIAWLYREQYARAGFVMLASGEHGAAPTARQVVIQTFLLVVVTLCGTPMGFAGATYFWVALIAGLGFLAAGIAFARSPDDIRARRLLRASLLYLPLVLGAFALDLTP